MADPDPADTLLLQQQALVRALWAPRPDDAFRIIQDVLENDAPGRRGLRAYRSNGRELAQRALAAAYPTVAQLVGDDNFAPMAQQLWLAHPPERGDLAQWGGAFAAWIASQPALAEEEPYLADVARVEWALHVAASARDAVLDAGSFTLLQTHDPAALTLRLAPGTACVASAWPVASIVLAHTTAEPALEVAAQRLQAGVPETALVWRQGLQPRLRAVGPDESAFVGALQEGRSLADACEAAPRLAFEQWLALAVQGGLVTGAGLLRPTGEASP